MKYEFLSEKHISDEEVEEIKKIINLLNYNKKGCFLDIFAESGFLSLSVLDQFESVHSIISSDKFYTPTLKDYRRQNNINNLLIEKVNLDDIKDFFINNCNNYKICYLYDLINSGVITKEDVNNCLLCYTQSNSHISENGTPTNHMAVLYKDESGKISYLSSADTIIKEPFITPTVNEEPVVEEEVVEEPVVEEPVVEEPVVEEPVVEEPVVEEPVVEEPVVEEPVVEEPVVEEEVVEETKPKRKRRSRKTKS
jgi:hypothetical protein